MNAGHFLLLIREELKSLLPKETNTVKVGIINERCLAMVYRKSKTNKNFVKHNFDSNIPFCEGFSRKFKVKVNTQFINLYSHLKFGNGLPTGNNENNIILLLYKITFSRSTYFYRMY